MNRIGFSHGKEKLLTWPPIQSHGARQETIFKFTELQILFSLLRPLIQRTVQKRSTVSESESVR